MINPCSAVTEPKVIFSVLSLQNPVMEETVWEQYTVTLQRVSPSVAAHTHTHRHTLSFIVVFLSSAQRRTGRGFQWFNRLLLLLLLRPVHG